MASVFLPGATREDRVVKVTALVTLGLSFDGEPTLNSQNEFTVMATSLLWVNQPFRKRQIVLPDLS
jgi:hypothetical protein